MAVERTSDAGAPQPHKEDSETPKTLSWAEILSRIEDLEARLDQIQPKEGPHDNLRG